MISSIQLSSFLIMFIEHILRTAMIIQIQAAILGENPRSFLTLNIRKDFKVEDNKAALRIYHKMTEI